VTKLKYILLWGFILLLLVSFWKTCNAQDVISRRVSTGTSDVNLDFVGDSTASATNDTVDAILNIPAGNTNKLLTWEMGGENYDSVSIVSVARVGGSALTEVATVTEASSGRQAVSLRYLLDADLPTSGDVKIRVIFTSPVGAAIRLRLYNGASQSAPVSNDSTYENCGGNTSSLVVATAAMGWSWTNNSCVVAVGCKINGSSTGSQLIDATCLDGDQSPTSPSATGSGHTSLGTITDVLGVLYSGYK
jgi:hypothetical protein